MPTSTSNPPIAGELTRPVAVACGPRLRAEVERHLEAVLGWHVVQEGSGWLRPNLLLVDGTVELPRGGVPPVLLVTDDVPADEAARRAVSTGAVAVLAWPVQRGLLESVGASLADRAPRPAGDRLQVGGGSGGVGTTTVALALGGLLAWASRVVLVVATGDVPVPDVPVVGDESLQGPGLWAVAARIPGVPDLRAVARSPGPAAVPLGVDLPDGVTLVLDLGVAAAQAEVLVVRRDRAGREAIAASPAGAIALLDDGPLSESEVLAPAGGRLVAVLPRWARVARAGAERRIPADLPASWLDPLRGIIGTAKAS